MRATDTGVVPISTPGAWLARFMKGTTKHCYMYVLNKQALGIVVSEKKIFFYSIPFINLWQMTPQGRGQFGPQGHSWQDL